MGAVVYPLTREAYTVIPRADLSSGRYLSLPAQAGKRLGRGDMLEYIGRNDGVPTVPGKGVPHRLAKIIDHDNPRSDGPVGLLAQVYFGENAGPEGVLYVRWLGSHVYETETGDDTELYCLITYDGID